MNNPIEALGFIVAVTLAIMCHEVAHGYAALWNGDPTAKYSGRLNFNPVNHFDLIGFSMFMLLGFGFAKPVPINPSNFRNYRKGLFWVSISGVLTNLILAFLAVPLFYLASRYLPDVLMFDEFFKYILIYMINVNIWFMVFNLLPI